MKIYENLKNNSAKLALVGLGYVGFPIAYAFAKKGVDVIAFDINSDKVNMFKKGIDPTNEVGNFNPSDYNICFTSEEGELNNATFYIVAVPTPINQDHTPDLTPVISACKTIGRNLSKNSIVVFESTVYPGVTEEVCLPCLLYTSDAADDVYQV